MSRERREGRLGPALLVALLVAALLAGVVVYHERTANLALEAPKLDRMLGSGGNAKFPVELEFLVRFDEPDALVEIVGAGDEPVRTFAEGVELVAEQRVACAWDGRDDSGEAVPPGNYRLRVLLPGQDRDMVFPQRILVRKPGGGIEVDADEIPGGAPCTRLPGGEPLL